MTTTEKSSTTADRLRRNALALFVEHGYDVVTVDDISRATGVSHMTFFRHFPTKASVLVDDPFDPAIAAVVAAQPVDLPPLLRVTRGLRAAWAEVEGSEDAETSVRLRLVADHPGLRAEATARNEVTAAAISEALTQGGTPPSDARIVAAAVLAALTSALFAWAHETSDRAEDREGAGPWILAALELLEATR